MLLGYGVRLPVTLSAQIASANGLWMLKRRESAPHPLPSEVIPAFIAGGNKSSDDKAVCSAF
jgi:hypothetical protein